MSPSVHTHFFHQYTSVPVCTISWFDIMPKAIPGKCDNCEWCEANGQDWCMRGSFGKKDIQHYSRHHSLQMERTIETAPYHWQTNNDLLKCVFWNVFHAEHPHMSELKMIVCAGWAIFLWSPKKYKPFQNWQSQYPNEREPHELVKITERRMKQTG